MFVLKCGHVIFEFDRLMLSADQIIDISCQLEFGTCYRPNSVHYNIIITVFNFI